MRRSSPEGVIPQATHWLASILVASLCLFVCLDTASAQTQFKTTTYEQKKREANDISVAIINSGLSCTCARFSEDMRNVINDLRPDGIRVLPVLGVGGLQNLKDVLFLKGIDMGIVDSDNLALLKKKDPKLYADIEQRVQYITKLYNAELHVLARNDIKSLADLKGKRVNFNVKEHQTEVTGDHLFAMLNIPVEKTNYDVEESIRRLLSGDLAAIMIVTGAPQSALAKLKKEDGLHFVPVDQDSLPGTDFTPVIAEYLPAEFTSKTYPNLVPEGTSVPTLANRALLVTYGWPEGSVRYNRVTKFVNELFGKIDEFHSPSRHPKWAEINLWADIPGWTRFKPASQWLASHQRMA
ncbi:MAG TPA: TAXI family TRAP transporter solute-binding subunit, partial [Geobacterales bacterium]|nr:TAXI family TRAP transporter solute-binding subunit [Geobacterales bacterium]